MDRALQDRLDALLHRPELPAAVDEDHLLRAAADRAVGRVVVHGLRGIEPLQRAAHRLGLTEQGRELPRPGVDARREAGRASPDDEQVVHHSRKRQIFSLLNIGSKKRTVTWKAMAFL